MTTPDLVSLLVGGLYEDQEDEEKRKRGVRRERSCEWPLLGNSPKRQRVERAMERLREQGKLVEACTDRIVRDEMACNAVGGPNAACAAQTNKRVALESNTTRVTRRKDTRAAFARPVTRAHRRKHATELERGLESDEWEDVQRAALELATLSSFSSPLSLASAEHEPAVASSSSTLGHDSMDGSKKGCRGHDRSRMSSVGVRNDAERGNAELGRGNLPLRHLTLLRCASVCRSTGRRCLKKALARSKVCRVHRSVYTEVSAPLEEHNMNSVLPSELLLKVFSHLGLYDLFRCRHVCRLWHRLLGSEDGDADEMQSSSSSSSSDSSGGNSGGGCGGSKSMPWRNLVLFDRHMGDAYNYTETSQRRGSYPRLKDEQLRQLGGLLEGWGHTSMLRRVYLDNVRHLQSDKTLAPLLTPHLTHLTIVGSPELGLHSADVMARLVSLQHFEVSDVATLSRAANDALFTACGPVLETFYVVGPSLDFAVLDKHAQSLVSLERLTVSLFHHHNNLWMQQLLAFVPRMAGRLQHLSLHLLPNRFNLLRFNRLSELTAVCPVEMHTFRYVSSYPFECTPWKSVGARYLLDVMNRDEQGNPVPVPGSGTEWHNCFKQGSVMSPNLSTHKGLCQWRLLVYPRGNYQDSLGDDLSIYVQLKSDRLVGEDRFMETHLQVSIHHQERRCVFSRMTNFLWQENTEPDWGFTHYYALAKLKQGWISPEGMLDVSFRIEFARVQLGGK